MSLIESIIFSVVIWLFYTYTNFEEAALLLLMFICYLLAEILLKKEK